MVLKSVKIPFCERLRERLTIYAFIHVLDYFSREYALPLFRGLWVCACVLSCSVLADSLWPHELWLARLFCLWNFSRQEYWRIPPFPPPRDLPDPGIKPASPGLAGRFFTTEQPGKPCWMNIHEEINCCLLNLKEAAKSCLTVKIPWTVACQAYPSMGFLRQENWSGVPFPFPSDLPDPGIKLTSPALTTIFFIAEPHTPIYIYGQQNKRQSLCSWQSSKRTIP